MYTSTYLLVCYKLADEFPNVITNNFWRKSRRNLRFAVWKTRRNFLWYDNVFGIVLSRRRKCFVIFSNSVGLRVWRFDVKFAIFYHSIFFPEHRSRGFCAFSNRKIRKAKNLPVSMYRAIIMDVGSFFFSLMLDGERKTTIFNTDENVLGSVKKWTSLFEKNFVSCN